MEELLNDQEIHMLGLQALIPWLEGHGFVVDYVQPEKMCCSPCLRIERRNANCNRCCC